MINDDSGSRPDVGRSELKEKVLELRRKVLQGEIRDLELRINELQLHIDLMASQGLDAPDAARLLAKLQNSLKHTQDELAALEAKQLDN